MEKERKSLLGWFVWITATILILNGIVLKSLTGGRVAEGVVIVFYLVVFSPIGDHLPEWIERLGEWLKKSTILCYFFLASGKDSEPNKEW